MPSSKPAHSGLRQTGKAPTRILIVDDSLVARTAMQRVISSAPDLVVAAQETTAEGAINILDSLEVDVILLDLEMPGMGGLEALPRILEKAGKAQVLVVSTLTQAGADATVAALTRGAADTLPKPAPGSFHEDYKTTLLAKIRGLVPSRPTVPAKSPKPARLRPSSRHSRAIGIGASTGGVHALSALLSAIPRGMPLPILVTQHLPAPFVPVFARQLALAASRECIVADKPTPLAEGKIIVASGDTHLVVETDGQGPVVYPRKFTVANGCLPSVDPMLASLSKATGGRATGIILSGMGRDGAEGAAELVKAGGTLLAQDAETSAVWGMPGAVVSAGLAHAVLSPAEIGHKIGELAEARAWS